jgi:peptide/nickel transport system ATP-binding protein
MLLSQERRKKMSEEKKVLFELKKLKMFFPIKNTSLFSRKKSYVRAVEDVNLEIYKGETFGLVGESGCGKSTLGRTILQLYTQTSGATIYNASNIKEFNLSYLVKDIKDLPKTQEKASSTYQKSLVLDAIAESLEPQIESAVDEKVKAQLVKKLEKTKAKSQDLKKEASRILREASRTVGELILETEINYIKDMLLYAYSFLSTSSEILLGLDGNYEGMKKEAIDAFEDIKKTRYSNPRQITELTQDKTYQEKLEGNREKGINLSKLNKEELRILRKRLQIIFQDPYSSLDTRLSVGNIIGEAVLEHGMFKKNSKEYEEYILKVMKDSGLDGYMIHRYPHQFSGGQKQRIGIARALALQPEFIVCDESVSALDVSIQSQIINLLMDLKEKASLTYLFISHDLSVIKHVSDRIGVMYLGNLVELANTDELYSRPLHPYTKALISAIPTTEGSEVKRIILEGEIPSNVNPPSGCKFRTRCPLCKEKCVNEIPSYDEVEPGHFVACHYYQETKDM